MSKGALISPFSLLTALFCILALFLANAEASHGNASDLGHLVLKHERKSLVVTESGEVSAVEVTDGVKGPFHLQFITLEPNSLFLPVLLHADMVFYVHTGSGTLSWTDDDKIRHANIRKGDVHRLYPGSVFYVQSSLEPERQKLRIYAFFSNTEDSIYEPSVGAYSRINDLILGFDPKILQLAFKAPMETIDEMLKATKPPQIIHGAKGKKKISYEWQARLLKAFLGSNRDSFETINGNKKMKTKVYNVFEADPDFENCNGWSLTVDRQTSRLLRDSNIGLFMVNLTKGAMMGPHWNPRASEIAVVLQGQGMIRVVCPSTAHESECKSLRFRVKEGDVFATPRFHPMAQMSFNNDSFVFMGFSTSTKRNYPQFLAGKNSVLQLLDTKILAASLNVTNTTIDQLLTPQKEAVILDCTSCAEEEETKMEEEIEREREEEEEDRKKEEEEEARRRQEEEARKREEEEARKREEEEARRRKEKEEEEARKRKEEEGEEKKREEEERERREEEERQRQEEREKEEKKRRRKEKQRRQEEEAAAREEEEARREDERRQRREEKEEEEEAERERESQGQGGQSEQPETEENGYEGERGVLKKVWKI